jgi:flagellar motor protein MotB
MSRKAKPPPKKPSKAYLVSFGDTMTALLAFFIVLNSFAKDQTGAQLHSGTGSFLRALKKTGSAGSNFGTRSDQAISRVGQTPIYAVKENDPQYKDKKRGPDDEDDLQRVLNRQAENFQRFLNEMDYRFQVKSGDPTESQIVFDSFEKIGTDSQSVLGPNAIQLASDAIAQLSNDAFELEIIVWANMPSELALKKANQYALQIEQFIGRTFKFNPDQRRRFSVTAQPWLFVDAARPKVSFVLSRLDR